MKPPIIGTNYNLMNIISELEDMKSSLDNSMSDDYEGLDENTHQDMKMDLLSQIEGLLLEMAEQSEYLEKYFDIYIVATLADDKWRMYSNKDGDYTIPYDYGKPTTESSQMQEYLSRKREEDMLAILTLCSRLYISFRNISYRYKCIRRIEKIAEGKDLLPSIIDKINQLYNSTQGLFNYENRRKFDEDVKNFPTEAWII